MPLLVLAIGSLGAGPLPTTAGPTGAVIVLAAIMLITAVAATISPAIRHVRPLARPVPERLHIDT